MTGDSSAGVTPCVRASQQQEQEGGRREEVEEGEVEEEEVGSAQRCNPIGLLRRRGRGGGWRDLQWH